LRLSDGDFNARTNNKLPFMNRVCQNIVITGLPLKVTTIDAGGGEVFGSHTFADD
jgi:hypothetical protein